MTPELIVTAVFVFAIVLLTFGLQAIIILVMVLGVVARVLVGAIGGFFCLLVWCSWWLRDRDAAMVAWRAKA